MRTIAWNLGLAASLITNPSQDFTAGGDRWPAITLLCRRICLLRQRGRSVEAHQLQSTQLATALTAARAAPDAAAPTGDDLRLIFQTEEKRVADAAVLGELLAPQLTEQILAAIAPPVVAPRRPPAGGVSPRSAPADIADLLDAMLAQGPPAATAHR